MGARGEVRGKEDSVVLLLKNMVKTVSLQKPFILSIFQRITHLAMSHSYPYQVGPDEVDEELHDEIQQECGKYGKVENVVIYQVAQALQ